MPTEKWKTDVSSYVSTFTYANNKIATWLGWEYLNEEGNPLGYRTPQGLRVQLPPWNKSDADAVELLSVLITKGYGWRMSTFYNVGGDMKYISCCIYDGKGTYYDISDGRGSTIAEAICDALLQLITILQSKEK